jgi:hypothetical protein
MEQRKLRTTLKVVFWVTASPQFHKRRVSKHVMEITSSGMVFVNEASPCALADALEASLAWELEIYRRWHLHS